MNFISIGALQSSGFYEFMLPFLLVTGITYGIFTYVKSKIENEDPNKKSTFFMNNFTISIVSVVIGLFATNNKMLRDFLFRWTPFFIILMIIIFLFLLVQKLFEVEEKNKDFMPVLILLVLILAVLSAFGTENLTRIIGLDGENVLWGIGFLIFVLILWGVYKMSHGKDDKPATSGQTQRE